jgi:hypothetical protein
MPKSTFIVSVAEPVPSAFAALIVTVAEPAKRGVPVMTPVVVFRQAQKGRPVALKLAAVLLLVIW